MIQSTNDHLCRICIFNAIMLIDEKVSAEQERDEVGGTREERREKDYKKDADGLFRGW